MSKSDLQAIERWLAWRSPLAFGTCARLRVNDEKVVIKYMRNLIKKQKAE
jgi:hypothetical protein